MANVQENVVKLEQANKEILEKIGKKVNLCLQCGICTGSCPINRFNKAYNPRQILRAATLGLKDRATDNDAIWLCLSCYSCTERCPKDVKPTKIIRDIRNLAAEKGRIHSFYNNQGTTIANFGRIFDAEAEKLINEMRDGMGLPPLSPVDLKEVIEVLKYTNIPKLLAKKMGGGAS